MQNQQWLFKSHCCKRDKIFSKFSDDENWKKNVVLLTGNFLKRYVSYNESENIELEFCFRQKIFQKFYVYFSFNEHSL